MSPITKMSGRFPTVQSGFTGTCPPRPTGTPTASASTLPSGDAFTPAAHTTVSVSMRTGAAPLLSG